MSCIVRILLCSVDIEFCSRQYFSMKLLGFLCVDILDISKIDPSG